MPRLAVRIWSWHRNGLEYRLGWLRRRAAIAEAASLEPPLAVPTRLLRVLP
jgi:hypothetical protein